MRFYHFETELDADVARVIVAGWTGRNAQAVAHHIDELAALGIPAPSRVPLYYRVSKTLLVQDEMIEVLGAETSGEAEPLLLRAAGQLWLGLVSDHTDRQLEAVSVAASKQACPKPVSGQLWRFDEVAPHIDELILRCHVKEEGQWVLYQDGTLDGIRPLTQLAGQANLRDGDAMLCGTLPAIGPIRPAGAYRMELVDKTRGRSLRLEYGVKALPVVA